MEMDWPEMFTLSGSIVEFQKDVISLIKITTRKKQM